jgi:type II secretory pathway pseudopilin PulG
MIAGTSSSARSQGRPGWGLIEVLVVAGILGVLVGLTLPAVQDARAAADRLSCQNRLRQIGVALHGYHDASFAFPPGQDWSEFVSYNHGAVAGVSWLAKILPFIGQESLWKQTQHAAVQDPVPWNNPPHVGLATVIPLYTCPSDPRVTTAQQGRYPPDSTIWPPANTLAAYTS